MHLIEVLSRKLVLKNLFCFKYAYFMLCTAPSLFSLELVSMYVEILFLTVIREYRSCYTVCTPGHPYCCDVYRYERTPRNNTSAQGSVRYRLSQTTTPASRQDMENVKIQWFFPPVRRWVGTVISYSGWDIKPWFYWTTHLTTGNISAEIVCAQLKSTGFFCLCVSHHIHLQNDGYVLVEI